MEGELEAEVAHIHSLPSQCTMHGVGTQDVADFLSSNADLFSVSPMCFVFADITESRANHLRTKGMEDGVLSDAFRCTQRNSLFWLLLRCLPAATANVSVTVGDLECAPAPIQSLEEGEAEPMWYIVDVLVSRHLEPKTSDEDTRSSRMGAMGEDADALWHEFWTNYRSTKASEPVATNAQLRAGVGGAPPKAVPVVEPLASTGCSTTRRWMMAGPQGHRTPRANYVPGPRTAGLTALMSSPPDSAPGSSRPCTRGNSASVAERIKHEMQQFEEQFSSMPHRPPTLDTADDGDSDEAGPNSPRSRFFMPSTVREPKAPNPSTPREKARSSAVRGSVITGIAPRVTAQISLKEAAVEATPSLASQRMSEMPLMEDLNSSRRGAKCNMNLPNLRREGQGLRQRYCFKGFDDYKHRTEVLVEVPRSKKKSPYYRPGLAMDKLPAEPGEPKLSTSAFALAREAEKDRLYAEQVMKEMAGRSQLEWSRAMREYVEVRKTRERPDLEGPATPRPMTPKCRNSSAAANFRRPWSREGMAQTSRGQAEPDGYLTPINRFAKVCLSSGLHPQPKSVRFLVSLPPKLDIRAAGYSDEDLLALAAALPFQGGIEAFDMGENSRLNDSSSCAMLSVLAKRHSRSMRALIMDHCGHLGKETVSLCTKLLPGPFCELQNINLSGVSIAMHEYGELASALEVHPHMRVVHLAKTGLGFFSKSMTAQVIRSIVANRRITELELGWNSLSLSAFEVLGKGLSETQHIATLGLASTGPCPDPEAGVSPLLVFLELLHGDAALTSLDISNNVLDGSAPVLLEYSLRRHPRLEFIDISRNPLGPDGMRSLIRMLAHPECQELTKIAAHECTGGRPIGDCNSFFDVDPSGRYTLNMANPSQRALLQLLLARLSERLPSAHLGTFFRDGLLTTSGKEQPFNFDHLKRGKGSGWQVPQAGDLQFELSAGSVLLSSEDDGMRPAVVVERITRRARMHMTCQRKALAVLTFIKSIGEESSRTVLLDALSRDFFLTPDQVKALCHTESKHVNCGHDPAGTCCILLASIFEAKLVRQAVSCTVTFSDALRINRAGHELLSLNLENPTGHYALALSEPMDRSTGERLMLLNRWQLHVWKAAGLFDISQHENGKSVRNETYSGRSFVWKAEEWHLPCGGARLSFDYVPLCRPPKDAEHIPQAKWEEVLSLVKRVTRNDAHRRKSVDQSPRRRRTAFQHCSTELRRAYSSLSETTPSLITSEDVLWALRAASGRFWLTCRQLRELLCLFHNVKLRSAALSYFFLRCLDWPVNGKLCRAKFARTDWFELRKCLGYINLFPYFQPECLSVSLDLAQHEQRRVMHALVRLSSAEQIRNIKKPRIDKNGTNNFEPFTAGIPMSWENYDSIPHRGIVELTYMCSKENVRLRARRRLAASVAGWTSLPEENNKLQNVLCWWSVLDDVPLEVVRVLVFLVTHFKDLGDAFNACDANKDGMLNHKEWVKKLQALKCAEGARLHREHQRDSPGPGSEFAAGPGTSHDQEEVLTAVYRFLDTSNDGDISKKEFEIFNAIWRELSQSMWELKMKLLHTFGSLEQAWATAELHEGEMPYSEFALLAGECQFDGPLKQIFLYLDQDNNDAIREAEWQRLEQAKQKAPD